MNRHRKQYPVKISVNLLVRDKNRVSLPQVLLAVVVFAKFAVIDRLVASGRALREAEKLEQALSELEQSNSDYDEVLREYQHYYFSAADTGSGETQVYVNCLDVLELLDTELLNEAGLQMVNLSGNVLTVNLTQTNLERASVIAKNLSENKMVTEVMVSAANRQDQSEGTSVFLNIVLEPEKGLAAEQEIDTQEADE